MNKLRLAAFLTLILITNQAWANLDTIPSGLPRVEDMHPADTVGSFMGFWNGSAFPNYRSIERLFDPSSFEYAGGTINLATGAFTESDPIWQAEKGDYLKKELGSIAFIKNGSIGLELNPNRFGNPIAGGWARGIDIMNAGATARLQMGALGSGDAITYGYIGAVPNASGFAADNTLRLYPTYPAWGTQKIFHEGFLPTLNQITAITGAEVSNKNLLLGAASDLGLEVGLRTALPSQLKSYVGSVTGAVSGEINGSLVLIPRSSITTAYTTIYSGSRNPALRVHGDERIQLFDLSGSGFGSIRVDQDGKLYRVGEAYGPLNSPPRNTGSLAISSTTGAEGFVADFIGDALSLSSCIVYAFADDAGSSNFPANAREGFLQVERRSNSNVKLTYIEQRGNAAVSAGMRWERTIRVSIDSDWVRTDIAAVSSLATADQALTSNRTVDGNYTLALELLGITQQAATIELLTDSNNGSALGDGARIWMGGGTDGTIAASAKTHNNIIPSDGIWRIQSNGFAQTPFTVTATNNTPTVKVEATLDVVAPNFKTFGIATYNGSFERTIKDYYSGLGSDITGNNAPHTRDYSPTKTYSSRSVGGSVGTTAVGWRNMDNVIAAANVTATKAHTSFNVSSNVGMNVELGGRVLDAAGKAWPIKIHAAAVGGNVALSTALVTVGTGVSADWYIASNGDMALRITCPTGSSWAKGQLRVDVADGGTGMVMTNHVVFQETDL